MSPGIVAESDLSGNLKSEYVFFDGDRVARKDFLGNSVFYYLSDHLKTASVITDSAGNIKEDEDYYPWGGELQFVNNDSNHYKFTSKERDSETGLDYFGARYYGNWLGRFITPDWSSTPVPVPYADLRDPQSLNQYSYVRNVPTSKADPDGHCCDEGLNFVTFIFWVSDLANEALGNAIRSAPWYVATPEGNAMLGTQMLVGAMAPLEGGSGVRTSEISEFGAEEITVGEMSAASESQLSAARETQITSSATASETETSVPWYRGAASETEETATPYSRSEHYGNPATSKAAKEIRAQAEGQPCPGCGKTMQTGTKNAPTAQHNPTLKSHYNSKGKKMTPSQRRAYARSKESMSGALCKECQSKEGAEEKRK